LMVKDGTSLHFLTAADNNLTQKGFWIYTNGTYTPASVLPVRTGGWVKSLAADEIFLYFPATTVNFPASDAVFGADEEEKPPPPPGLTWSYNSGGLSAGGSGGCFIDTAGSGSP